MSGSMSRDVQRRPSRLTEDAFQGGISMLLLGCQLEWLRRVQKIVPQPYLDEFFHMPQADTFWQGNWSQWDDKITTPPGLYIWSIVVSKIYTFIARPFDSLSPYRLRMTSALALYSLTLSCALWMRVRGKSGNASRRLPQLLAIHTFPLLFFFSGLYYTDVFSAFTVIFTYFLWQAGLQQSGKTKVVYQLLHFVCGLVALAARQTNIFWVAVFIGGLQAVHSIRQKTRVHDPPVADAYFEDFPITIISLVTSALNALPELLIDLWPHIGLLASFAAFVAWNGGVVLGDKTNHIASIHLPQMLYLWPCLMFFSWPAVLPQLANPAHLRHRLPRLWLSGLVMICMLAIVHFNTIIHPFLLADNRHYTFYVFKILRLAPWTWYAAVPVYAICAWVSVQALASKTGFSGGPGVKASRGRRPSTSSGRDDSFQVEADTNRISFLLVWLLSTALSLITAPLVEPRYFIVPWLMWRLHVPDSDEVLSEDRAAAGTDNNSVKKLLDSVARHSVWVEAAWYMLINFTTCRWFLYYGFGWHQQPGDVQRFMW